MAKTKGPLFSIEARGSLGKILNYSQRKSGSQCRKYNKPLKAATPAQRGQRRLTEFLVAQWQNMSAGDKATWATNAAASKFCLSGYHYFLKQAQRDLYTHHGLMAFWPCNNFINDNIPDLSGNGNTGIRDITPPTDAPILAPGFNTKLSNSLYFDGEFNALNCGNDKTLNLPSTITIEFFIKVPSVATAATNFIMNKRIPTHNLYAAVLVGGKIRFRPYGLTETGIATNISITANAWHMINFTYDGVNMRTYINGNPQGVVPATGTITATSASILYLGAGYGSGTDKFTGYLDEVCFYKRVLSAAEIYSRYNFAIRKV